jgi:signal transduction histidine kinase
LTVERFRKLKHDLRTPVNHILGYSELIQEAAADAGDEMVVVQAKNIQTHGRLLACLMEELLLSGSCAMDAGHFDSLQSALGPLIQQILLDTMPDQKTPGISSYTNDLRRVRSAAEQLGAFIKSGPAEP